MTKVLGLTGGIASGKSLVSDYFLARGIPVIDGDKIARKIVAPNTPTLKKIVAYFGEEIIDEAGYLKRRQLGQLVFADEKKLAKLNEIMRAALVENFEEAIEAAKKQKIALIVLDIPLLFEQHYEKYCDEVMVVAVSGDTQLARLKARDGFDTLSAQKRIAAQMPLSEKILRADVVIDNNGSVENTRAQVQSWLNLQVII